MTLERELGRRLRELRAPNEAGAERRAREVVRAAHAEHEPAPRSRRLRRLAIAALGCASALAVGLSPAGARVADLVTGAIGVGSGDAEPALTRLPAPGELLVESDGGAWIVRADGSKRRLGDFDQAAWSPNGLFVAAAGERQLAAVDPQGEVRWTVPAPAGVRDPRWSGTDVDTRIAYRSSDELRVVAGDGTGDASLARGVAPVAPAWLPAPPVSKLRPELPSGAHVLAYAPSGRAVELVDVDRGRALARIPVRGSGPIEELALAPDGSLLVVRARDALLAFDPRSGRPAWRVGATTAAVAVSPDGRRVAALTEPDAPNRESRLLVIDAGSGAERRLPAGLGRFTDVAWSPGGRWLLLAWRAADQWLFLRPRPDRPPRVEAVGGISRQFSPGSSGTSGFPGIAGWILPGR